MGVCRHEAVAPLLALASLEAGSSLAEEGGGALCGPRHSLITGQPNRLSTLGALPTAPPASGTSVLGARATIGWCKHSALLGFPHVGDTGTSACCYSHKVVPTTSLTRTYSGQGSLDPEQEAH